MATINILHGILPDPSFPARILVLFERRYIETVTLFWLLLYAKLVRGVVSHESAGVVACPVSRIIEPLQRSTHFYGGLESICGVNVDGFANDTFQFPWNEG